MQPLVELDEVGQQLSAGLQASPLERETQEQSDVVADDVSRTEDAVRKVGLVGEVRVV